MNTRHIQRHHLHTILCASFQLHPTTWQERPPLLFLLPSSTTAELDFTSYFRSKIEMLQAFLHVRPHTHTHVRTKDTHRETEPRAPCGHAFFCLPVSNVKNDD